MANCTFPASRTKPFEKYSLGSLGALGCPPAPAVAQDTPSLQERGWWPAWHLGPISQRPAAAGCWFLSGCKATPRWGWRYRNLRLSGASTQRALPPPRRIPPRCHHQPCRSEELRQRRGPDRWSQAPPHDGPFLAAATCSHLGQELLVAGGNVVDAGVGAALCLAVVHPHATGLGQLPTALHSNSNPRPGQ